MTAKEMFEKLTKKPWVLGVAAGAVLLLLSCFVPKQKDVLPHADIDLKAETVEYKERMTNELCDMLQTVEGVGEVKLFLTFDGSVEYEYLKEENENTDTGIDDRRRDYSERYLFVEDKAGNKSVLAVKRLTPKAKGAAVVCEGGADPVVRQAVVELLRAALGISSANISVSPLA